jgi:hypothetical protein
MPISFSSRMRVLTVPSFQHQPELGLRLRARLATGGLRGRRHIRRLGLLAGTGVARQLRRQRRRQVRKHPGLERLVDLLPDGNPLLRRQAFQ